MFKERFNFKKLWFLTTGLLLLVLLILSIFQLNAYAQEFYLIKDYQQKINRLTKENKVLEISFSEANSLNKLNKYVQEQTFEKAEKVDYIQLLESTALAK